MTLPSETQNGHGSLQQRNRKDLLAGLDDVLKRIWTHNSA